MQQALDRLPKSKLRYRVMLLDAIRAAAWAGYRYFRADYWDDLSPEDQAYTIAAYQLDREIDSLMQHEAIKKTEQATKSKAS